MTERKAAMTHSIINAPQWDGTPREAGTIWTLHKGTFEAVCTLWSHPIGCEARVEAAGRFVRSEASRDGLALLDLAMTWKGQFQQKGWKDWKASA